MNKRLISLGGGRDEECRLVNVYFRGYGDKRPLRDARNERAYAYNRRVELVTQ